MRERKARERRAIKVNVVAASTETTISLLLWKERKQPSRRSYGGGVGEEKGETENGEAGRLIKYKIGHQRARDKPELDI